MRIGQITSGQVASSVWGNTARTLTTDLMQEIVDEGVTAALALTTAASQGGFGSYVQVVASTAHTVRGIDIHATCAAAHNIEIRVSVGGAGSEVDKIAMRFVFPTTTTVDLCQRIVDTSLWPKGSRVAVHAANQSSGTADAVTVMVTILEAND